MLLLAAAAEPGAAKSGKFEDDLRALQLLTNSLLLRDGGRPPSALEKEEIEKVRAVYERLRAENPARVEVANAYASFLWSIRHWDEAMAQWEAAEKLDAGNAETAHELGSCHLELGHARKATDYFAKASRLAPENARYRFDFANACFLFRHELVGVVAPTAEEVVTRALEDFRKAAELDPFNVDYAKAYAQTFYGVAEPDWQAALAAWEHYRALTRNQDFAWSNLARVALKLGRRADAIAYLDRIESKDFQQLKEGLLKQAQEP